ncbi:MAG: GUN4 domain-containing protein [Elainella sp. Prado103]|jgi:hypothetical protein|nr:GUN4 domain-containing protein [Elainella sp. Prado103]
MAQSSPLPDEKDDKSPWNDKLAGIIIQAVAGGSIGTFATLLNSSDLPKLALGGVIGGGVAPIVFAVAEPISKKLKQGAGYLGETTASGTEDTAQKWLTSLSGFERKYLQALQAYCHALEVEGFRGNLPPLALADVFIPLRLDTDRGNVYGQARVDTTIWHFLPQTGQEKTTSSQRLAIVADPGYGKTTLTRYLALSYSCPTYEEQGAAKLLPVLLRFRDIHSLVESETQPKLESLIVQMIKGLPNCSELQVTEPWMKQQLKDGKCLIMLDGLDEVPEQRRETLSRWAKRQMQEYDSFFILTSRPHGYDASLFQGGGVRQLGILDFTNDQKREFLEKWYRVVLWRQKWEILLREHQQQPSPQLSEEQAKAQSEAEAQRAVADLYRQIVGNLAINTQLAVNPLLLTIIASTHNAFDALPERRVNLYRKMFGLLLEDRPNRRDTRLKLKEAAQNQVVLQALALNLVQRGETQFTPKQGAEWIKARLAEQCSETECTPQQFLREIEQVAGLLTGGDSDLYQFAHKTFQEYLTAVEIQDQKEQGLQSLLEERLQREDWKSIEDWREIVSFYAALEGADWFVQAVAAMPDGEKRQQSLVLLYQIVKEEKSRIKQPKLREQLDELLATVQLTGTTAAKITLEQRFQQMIRLDERTEITATPITWGEYQRFLEAQNAGQFHSTAQPQMISPEQLDLPVTGLSLADRNWFCAWLPTQPSLQVNDALFIYELPDASDYKRAKIAENRQLYVIRETIHAKYGKLLNYLTSASWLEADQETYRLMITTVGKKEGEWFNRADLENFPCEDLRTIDRLWVNYSKTPDYPDGKWGFSVQKRIWQECNSPMFYNKDWEKFGDRVGWRKDGEWLNHIDFHFNLEKSLAGEYPLGILVWWGFGGRIFDLSSLAQRLVDCNTSQS